MSDHIDKLANSITSSFCDCDVADPDHPDTVCANLSDLHSIIVQKLEPTFAELTTLRAQLAAYQSTISQILALAPVLEGATKGEWKACGRYVGTPNHRSFIAECRDQNGYWTEEPMPLANAAAIVAGMNFLRDALAEMEKSK